MRGPCKIQIRPEYDNYMRVRRRVVEIFINMQTGSQFWGGLINIRWRRRTARNKKPKAQTVKFNASQSNQIIGHGVRWRIRKNLE